MNIGYYNSPIGIIKICAKGDAIIELNINSKFLEESSNDVIEECKTQLGEYFNGKRTKFNIKLDISRGTEFQQKVWNQLREVQYGEIVSYKDIAESINNPKAVRAVGGANNRNPIAIIIPCHRVVGSNGKLVGYEWGLNTKKYLLDLEGKNIKR